MSSPRKRGPGLDSTAFSNLRGQNKASVFFPGVPACAGMTVKNSRISQDNSAVITFLTFTFLSHYEVLYFL